MIDEQRYLTEMDKELNAYADQVQSLDDKDEMDLAVCEKIRGTLLTAIQKEEELRKSCEIGARFNIVRTQLQGLLRQFEKEVETLKPKEVKKEEVQLADNMTLVYVYLFNAQGGVLKSWKNLLSPRAMIEHSVNRPIYIKQEEIEKVLRSKPNPSRHAYIIVSVNNDDIMQSNQGAPLQDPNGFDLLRLRQGSLKKESIKQLVHQGNVYQVLADGTLLPRGATSATSG